MLNFVRDREGLEQTWSGYVFTLRPLKSITALGVTINILLHTLPVEVLLELLQGSSDA